MTGLRLHKPGGPLRDLCARPTLRWRSWRWRSEAPPVHRRRGKSARSPSRSRSGHASRDPGGKDEYAGVFRDQPFTDEEQFAFAQRLGGRLHAKTGSRVLYKSRLGNEALRDTSNVDETGDILQSDDR